MVEETNIHLLDEAGIWKELGTISDPEIPVLSLVDMKIIRGVSLRGRKATILFSPTFVGCPALDQMKSEIRTHLAGIGCTEVDIQTVFSPPWSTEMLDDEARRKLREFGIAPPLRATEIPATLMVPATCPFCGSVQTHMESEFGATLCKQIFYCDDCRQSFERFKTI